MPRLVYSDEALQDLARIQRYIREQSGSASTAKRFRNRLRAPCTKLGGLPQIMGRARPELAEGLRSVVEGNYLIVLRYVGDALETVNIVERHRDIGPALGQNGHGSDPEPDET